VSNSLPNLQRILEVTASNQPDPDDLRLLRPEKVMDLLDISRRTLQELTAKGLLPSVLVSRKCRRYPVDGLRRWLAERMEGPLE
jgi:hypothetical protein